MSEQKKVSDALETLGTILEGGGHRRDAIHVATMPAVAATPLAPGTHVGRMADGRWAAAAPKKVGIVDPFLTAFVRTDQRFWVLLYPRTVTSLRHAWTHPDIEDEA